MAQMRSVGVRLRMFVDEYARDADRAKRKTDEIGDAGKRTKKSLADMADGMAIAGGILVAAVGVAVVATARFDKQMSEVGAVANATAGELDELRQAALDAGVATAFSATEAAQAEAELAKAGLATAEILGGALTGALSLASAGSLDLATAAGIAAAAMNTFDLAGQDVEHIADVLAAASNKSATSVESLGMGLAQVGLVAAQVGFGLEETVALLAAMADRGLDGSDAATSLKTALLRLAAPQAEAAEAMKKYGISLYDANGNMVDAVTIAGQLREGLGDLSSAERNAALSTIFGSDAIRAANVLYEEGSTGVRDYINAVDDQGAAADVARKKLDNLAGDVEALGGSLETLLITSGGGASEGLRALTQAATGLVNAIGSLPDEVLSFGTIMVGLTGTLLLGTAAFVKTRAAVLTMNASLIATGPAGAIAAAGLRGVLAAALPATLAIIAIDEGLNALGYRFEYTGRLILRDSFVNRLGGQMDVLQETAYKTGEAVDSALAKMVGDGRAAEALGLVQEAAAAAGMSIDTAKLALPEFTAALEASGAVTEEQASAAAQAARNNVALAGAFGEAATEANGLLNAFRALNGEVLDSREATRSAEAAVDKLQEALIASGGSMDVTTEKGRAAEAAVDDLAAAAAAAAQAKYDETGSVEEANAAYQNYIGQLRQTLINAGMAEGAVDALISRIAQMPTYKAINLDVSVQLRVASATGFGMAAFSQLAKGGVVTAATGRLDAGIVDQPTVLFGERQTGEEAFIPKQGITQSRAMAILGEAASWHGAQVIPEGGFHSAASMPQSVDLRVSVAAGADGPIGRAVEDHLRFQSSSTTGTSVQSRLGARGRYGA